jgi:organic radical activating enzyme
MISVDMIERDVHYEWTTRTHVKPLIVITGGEPLRQPIGGLCDLLSICGYRVQIESNGVFPPGSTLEYLCLTGKVSLIISPKTTRIHPASAGLAVAFKYVLSADSIDPNDGLPIKALDHPASTGVARPPEGFKGEIYLNPFDAKNETDNALNLSAVVNSCLKYGHRCGIQLHKLINVE